MKLHLALFAISLSTMLLDPAAAYGLALGWEGFSLVAVITGVACFLAAAFWTGIFEYAIRRERPPRIYSLLVLVFTQLNAWQIGQGAESEWRIGKMIHTKKIEYHCASNFNPQRCVQLVVTCADCVSDIPRWKRQAMTESLKQISF